MVAIRFGWYIKFVKLYLRLEEIYFDEKVDDILSQLSKDDFFPEINQFHLRLLDFFRIFLWIFFKSKISTLNLNLV